MSHDSPVAQPDNAALKDDDRPKCKRRPESLDDLEFTRQPRVSWLNPGVLLQSIYQSQLANIFGVYADKREMLAVLGDPQKDEEEKKKFDYSETSGGEIWIDYVSDVGEGFAATYTLAWLLAQKTLPNPAAERRGPPLLPRGRILVMGGDEVYPTPGKEEYRDRMSGPYDAALPCLPDKTEVCPHLYAIPGNHDWYDGLTSFLRQFCQGRAIGAWKTQQSRSYWALKLPHGWWLWGTDFQFGADIDRPQIEYFVKKAQEAKEAEPGGRVILCTAEPGWVDAGREALRREKERRRKGEPERDPEVGKQDGFDNLEFFERIIRKNGLVLAATLSGDAHHYARYSYIGADGRESVTKITAGGGGAHLSPTHHLPDDVPLAFSSVDEDENGEAKTVRLGRRAEFPTQKESRRLVWGLWRLGRDNPGMAIMLPFVYAVLFLCFHGGFVGWRSASSDLEPLSGMLLGNGVLLALLVLPALFAVANLFPAAAGWVRFTAAFLHFLVHVSFVVTAAALAVKPHEILISRYGPQWRWEWMLLVLVLLAFSLGMFLVGRYIGIGLMALYFWLAEKFGVNESEALAAQSIEDYKNFLRLHVTAEAVTVYPFGIREVVKRDDWIPNPGGQPGAPLLEPKPGQAPKIHLIEEPIVIPWNAQPPYPSAETQTAVQPQPEQRVPAPGVFGDPAPVPDDGGERQA